MRMIFAALLGLAVAPAFCADWNPKAAADYLDGRQKEWSVWPRAKIVGGQCLSCHTGATYLLARPALRAALGEKAPTQYETGLMDAVRARLDIRDPEKYSPGAKEAWAAQNLGTESVWSSLFLAFADAPRGKLSADGEKAFDRLWALQQASGDGKGSWHWNMATLDPWEMPESEFYGTAVAALATGIAPGDYQSRPDIQENVASMREYLRTNQAKQPLHNRLILLWASMKLRDTLSDAARHEILNSLTRTQQPDGGWTLEALGAWKGHETAPAQPGSNSYATALVAFVAQQAGVKANYPALAKALDWLRAHQNPETGFWEAASMNKKYAPDYIPSGFMRDAATAYASLALLEKK